MTAIHYRSTRGQAPALGFAEAILGGLAEDGGLTWPDRFPVFAPQEIAGFAGRPFVIVAAEVMARFAGDAVPRATIDAMAEAAYATFHHPATVPLVQVAPQRFVLELFHGPTLAFKDVAMQVLARLMDHLLAERGERATIVAATSGDTGGAAVEAFRGSSRVDCVVLFPDGRVSDVQRRMMTTPPEDNIHALAIAGDFDACQALVKGMFNHHAFRREVALAGVNSINWGRIVAQVAYYIAAAAALGSPHRRLRFAVPTGNFGDILAGWVASRMGLPIERLVIATNDNDILVRTLATGRYATAPVHVTSSPSMDIQVSSNFERLLFALAGEDSALIRAQMASLRETGAFDLTPAQRQGLARDFAAARADGAEVAAAIRSLHAEAGYLLDPHTACAAVALDKLAPESATTDVILATAHPAKFPDAMEGIIGERPALPPRLAGLMTAPERITWLPAAPMPVETFIRAHARAVLGRAA